MYEDGDDATRKVIAEAWLKSREDQARGGGARAGGGGVGAGGKRKAGGMMGGFGGAGGLDDDLDLMGDM